MVYPLEESIRSNEIELSSTLWRLNAKGIPRTGQVIGILISSISVGRRSNGMLRFLALDFSCDHSVIPKGSRYIKGVCSLYYTNTPTKQKIYKNYKSIVSEDLILKKSIFQNDNITIEKCK